MDFPSNRALLPELARTGGDCYGCLLSRLGLGGSRTSRPFAFLAV